MQNWADLSQNAPLESRSNLDSSPTKDPIGISKTWIVALLIIVFLDVASLILDQGFIKSFSHPILFL